MKRERLEKGWLWARRGLALAVLGTVTWLSLADGESLRAEVETPWFWGLVRALGVPADKAAHAVMYFGLCGTLWMALPGRVRGVPSPWWAFGAAVAWGALMECGQWAVTALGWACRSFDLRDMAANACGAAVAAAVCGALMMAWALARRRWARR